MADDNAPGSLDMEAVRKELKAAWSRGATDSQAAAMAGLEPDDYAALVQPGGALRAIRARLLAIAELDAADAMRLGMAEWKGRSDWLRLQRSKAYPASIQVIQQSTEVRIDPEIRRALDVALGLDVD